MYRTVVKADHMIAFSVPALCVLPTVKCCSHWRLISKLVRSIVVAMAYMLIQVALANVVTMQRGEQSLSCVRVWVTWRQTPFPV